jgi:hypothetical protein
MLVARRTVWKAGDAKDKARRDRLFAADISKYLRRSVGDLRDSVNSGGAATYTPGLTSWLTWPNEPTAPS